MTLSVRLSIYLSHKCDFSEMDEPILMKLYTFAVYILRMCMKKDNSGPKHYKGDNYLCWVCDLTHRFQLFFGECLFS